MTIIQGSASIGSFMTPSAGFHRVLMLATFVLCGVPLFAQREMMTFGVKGGAQVTESFTLGTSSSSLFFQETNYTKPNLGLTFEKPLWHGISIGMDAIYKSERFRSQEHSVCFKQGCVGRDFEWESHGYTLEFPVVVKKYWSIGNQERYFVDSGLSFRRTTLSNWVDPSVSYCFPPPTSPVPFCDYIVQNSTHGSFGLVIGSGVDFRFDHFHLYPELRYTRWRGNEFTGDSNILQPKQDALKILFGFSYGW
jgi:hypothetical protein